VAPRLLAARVRPWRSPGGRVGGPGPGPGGRVGVWLRAWSPGNYFGILESSSLLIGVAQVVYCCRAATGRNGRQRAARARAKRGTDYDGRAYSRAWSAYNDSVDRHVRAENSGGLGRDEKTLCDDGGQV